jgi:copper chaperone CopZ
VNIATALERLPGVKRADVRLETGQAKVIYDDTTQTADKLAAAIDKLGFKASVLSVTEAPASEGPARPR